MLSRPEPTPQQRTETLRQSILAQLREGPRTARDLSGLVRATEKEIVGHLEHLQKTLRRSRQRMVVEPAECLDCGYTFSRRIRLTRPGRCPSCRSERIEPPVFRVPRGEPAG